MKPAPVFYWVVCADYVLGPYPERSYAERTLKGIVDLDACRLPHSIEETTTPGRRPPSRFARY